MHANSRMRTAGPFEDAPIGGTVKTQRVQRAESLFERFERFKYEDQTVLKSKFDLICVVFWLLGWIKERSL